MKKSGVRSYNSGGKGLSVMISILLLAAYCLLPAISFAHKVSVYGYAEDGKVFVEGYFVDGSKAKNSLVEVFDAETGQKLLEGKTDQAGTFSFEIPRLTALKLVITASMGHKNDYTLSREEVAEAMGMDQAGVRSQKSGLRSQESKVGDLKAVQKGKMPAEQVEVVNTEELERVVEKVMERKLKPIKSILVKMQKESARPGITEILGGIGYIIGLMGIALYFKSRKRG